MWKVRWSFGSATYTKISYSMTKLKSQVTCSDNKMRKYYKLMGPLPSRGIPQPIIRTLTMKTILEDENVFLDGGNLFRGWNCFSGWWKSFQGTKIFSRQWVKSIFCSQKWFSGWWKSFRGTKIFSRWWVKNIFCSQKWFSGWWKCFWGMKMIFWMVEIISSPKKSFY